MRLGRHVSLARTEHGTVLLDGVRGRYWQLNDSAAEVLDALLAGQDEGVAARRIGGGDLVGAQDAVADVRALVAHLADAELVVP